MIRWGVSLILLFAGAAQAQEIRCNQVFMNPSEKAICGSAELLAIDAQMARAYREAKPHLDGIRKDQRAFKRERKACKGEIACLLKVYETQISELRSAVPPMEPAVASESEDGLVPSSEPAMSGVVSDVTRAAPVAPANKIDEVSASIPSAAPTNEPAGKKDTSSNWIVLGVIVFVVISAIASFFSWLFKAVGRCPRCTKWWAAEEIGRDEHVGTEYETVTRTDERRNRAGNLIDTIHRKEQVAHNVVRAAIRNRCRSCGNVWTQHDKRRI